MPLGEQQLAGGQRELVLKMARSRFGDQGAQSLPARVARESSFEHLAQILELLYSRASGDTLLDQLQQQEA